MFFLKEESCLIQDYYYCGINNVYSLCALFREENRCELGGLDPRQQATDKKNFKGFEGRGHWKGLQEDWLGMFFDRSRDAVRVIGWLNCRTHPPPTFSLHALLARGIELLETELKGWIARVNFVDASEVRTDRCLFDDESFRNIERNVFLVLEK